MRLVLTILAAVAALAACGGGGGDSPVVATSAEGAYQGTLTGTGTTATSFQALILENAEYWVLYGFTSGGINYISGFIQGNGTTSGSSFTSSNALDFGVAPARASTVNATFVQGSSFAGTFTNSAGTATFNGTAIPAASYNYNQTASLADVAGTWSLTSANTVTPIPVTISATGTFTATSSGCTVTGSVTPRASGKNVFNVTVQTGGTGCAVPNSTAGGIAITYPIQGTTQKQLILAGTYSRAAGFLLFGTK